MAELTSEGCIIAHCPGCNGSRSAFEWIASKSSSHSGQTTVHDHGSIVKHTRYGGHHWRDTVHRLYRCPGCGAGGLGVILMESDVNAKAFPEHVERLVSFFPDVRERLALPNAAPDGIKQEFREAEACLDAGCFRAAAGLFRSVLDKTLRANGYKIGSASLQKQIDDAAADGVITESRKKRAHEEIRVLGNDVLHDEWEPVGEDAVELAHHYAQRILEDFYDDRPTTLTALRAKSRVPEEDKPAR